MTRGTFGPANEPSATDLELKLLGHSEASLLANGLLSAISLTLLNTEDSLKSSKSPHTTVTKSRERVSRRLIGEKFERGEKLTWGNLWGES